MRLLYSHDNPFIRHDGRVYSQGSFTSKTWDRFLPHVDELVVVARGWEGTAQEVQGMNRADAPGVAFCLSRQLPVVPGTGGWRSARAHFEREVDQADIVVLRMPSLFGLVAGPIALRRGKPLACEVVGCVWDAYWNYGGLSAKAMAGKMLAYPTLTRTRALIRRAELAVYVTSRFLQGRYPCPGRCESASNVELIEPGPDVLPRRIERINTDKDPDTPYEVGLIGSLKHRYKGWDTAIRALGRLPKRHRVRLRILGSGDPAAALNYKNERGVDAEVVCDGILPAGRPVLDWMDRLDCYVQPSLQEGLPRSVIEAMSRGLPCLGTDIAGIPELIGPDCLFKPRDDAGLAQRLTRLIEDRCWALGLAQANFENAKPFYATRLGHHRDAVWKSFIDAHRGAR